MANPLLGALRENDKEGLFQAASPMVCYPSGIPTLDYRLGYTLIQRDENDVIVNSHDSLGIVGGSFITLIGKSGTAKTAMACKMGAEIVRGFKSSFVLHYDLEQALNATRIMNITGLSTKEYMDHYVLKSSRSYIEDIFDSIIEIANEKQKNKKLYQYKEKYKDEFGQDIVLYEPTVIVLDSIPVLATRPEQKKVKAKKGSGQEDYYVEDQEIEGQTYSLRVAKALKQFFSRLIPIIKEFNITIISINHINQKLEMNAFAKTQAQVLYLKQDETLPGGNAPIYYANTLIKHVAVGSSKTKMEEDGWTGFRINAEIIKSRTNASGVVVPMVYDQNFGFSKERTLLEYAKDLGLVNGSRVASRYLGDDDSVKFNEKDIVNEYRNREEVRLAFDRWVYPELQKMLSRVNADEAKDLLEGDNNGISEDALKKLIE